MTKFSANKSCVGLCSVGVLDNIASHALKD